MPRIQARVCCLLSGMCKMKCWSMLPPLHFFCNPESSRRYNFKSDPRSVGAVVVLAANESSYSGLLISSFLSVMCLTSSQTLAHVDSIKGHLTQQVRHRPSSSVWVLKLGF